MKATYFECVYCNSEIEGDPEERSLPSTEAEWTQEARRHAPDCEWVLTRAHTQAVENEADV